MEKHRTVRTIAALLMVLAFTLPVAPAATAQTQDGEVEVRAAHLSQIVEAADCTASTDGTARYFATIRSTTGVDIPNAAAKLIFTGIPALLPPPNTTIVNLFNGDFESQAADGNQPSCVPAVNDGHANDVGSGFIPSLPGVFTWNMVITAPGFLPVTIPALPTDGQGACPLGDPDPQRAGCLISIGQQSLQPLAAVAGRGTVAGSLFGSDGRPLDNATLTLKDISGNVHTRVSGSNCINGNVVSLPGTGFFCFDDSSPTVEDGTGLPVGPAIITVVNNTPANCGIAPVTSVGPGAVCGFLPATVTVNVAAATVTGQDITLQNKFAPAPPAPAGAGAFGYVVNDQGQGVGGITITAGGLSATTATQTGLWVLTGLPAATNVNFVISGPGLSATNVRPGLTITRTTGPVGTWIDPSWIIVNSPGPLGVTLPITGSAIIRGQVTDSQGAPFTGTGGFVILFRLGVRDIQAATNWTGNIQTVNPVRGGGGLAPFPNLSYLPYSSSIIFVAATALDAGGNYCFGAAPPSAPGTTVLCGAQPPLVPDEYLVTVVDDRPVACVPGFQPPVGGIGPAPCGHLPQTSQPVIAQSDRIATVNFQLQARFSPGGVPGSPFAPGSVTGAPLPFPGGTVGVFGFIWDMGIPGGRPIEGQTVYAVAVPPGIPAPGSAVNAASFLSFVAQVPLTGLGVLTGNLTTSNPPPALGGITLPTYPGSDAFGMYRINGLAPGTSYAIIVEVGQGYNNCAPFNVNVGAPVLGYPFAQTGILQPTGLIRCAVHVTTPTAAATPWAAGADFAMAPQLLRPVEPGEVDRRLEHVLPLVANGAPTAPLGGWDVNTTEIHVTNAGAQRTVAEVRFYASDGLGGAGVLAGTATADLMPGGGRVFRGAEIPGGFLGWAGIWSFDADGPGGVYGASSLVVESTAAIRNADNAITSIAGVTREEIGSPQNNAMVPLVYRNYGGTRDKWSSLLISTNVGDSAPVVFAFRAVDRVRGDARSCSPCLITRHANRGGLVTLNLGDNNDPEIALLGEGTFIVEVQAGGALLPSGTAGFIPGAVGTLSNLPGGHVAEVINVTVSGKMANNSRAQIRLGPSQLLPSFEVENRGGLYAPLLFNGYNGWESAISLSTGQTSGGVSGFVTVTFQDEAGGFVGEYNDRISSSGQPVILYLPALQFLPEAYRGTAVVRSGAAAGTAPGAGPSLAMAGWVNHVNYDRMHSMSYNLIGSGAVDGRGEALGEIPCVSLGFTTCAWAADVSKTGAVDADGGLGLNTGIRIFNPDPPQLGTGIPSGLPARVVAMYIDNSGVIWNEATQEFQIPAFGTHTLFPAYNRRLPDVFRGTVRLMSTGNSIVAVANTVDYSVIGRDASGSYNLQYHTGRTR
jgi:hypothetical protein